MFEPLLDKSPAPPAAVTTPSPPRRAAPSVSLTTPPPRSSPHQLTAAPSPPPPMSSPTPPRSATAPSSATPTITARSASPPLGPASPSASPSQQAEAEPYTTLSGLLGGAPGRHDSHMGGSGGSSVVVDEDVSVTFFGRLLRRRRRDTSLPIGLPVSVPNNGGEASRIGAWVQTLRRDLMPESDIHQQLAIFGFVLYGIMTLLPSTQALIKEFSPGHRVGILLALGFVWTLSSTGVRCTISGRTILDHTVAKVASWIGMISITLLVIFHIGLMLPQNYWRKEGDLNKWSAGGFVALIIFAILGHVAPLLLKIVCCGNDKMEAPENRSSEVQGTGARNS